MKIYLEPCLFCTSESAKLVRKSKRIGTNGLDWPVDRVTYYVRCNVCHARGPIASGKVLYHPPSDKERVPWEADEENLKAKAVHRWNYPQ